MICDCCKTFAAYFLDRIWDYLKFMPNCIYCNARYIQYMQRLSGNTKPVIGEACRRILDRAKGYGNDEAQLRALARAQGWAAQPQERNGRSR